MTEVQDFDSAFERIASRQRAARWQTLLAVLLPAALGFAFLVYGSTQLQEASSQVGELRSQAQLYQAQLDELRAEVEARTATITELQQQIDSLSERLTQATNLARFVHPLDPVDSKFIASTLPLPAARVMQTIFELSEAGVPWRLGGTSPDEGFDSPSFAAFVLQTGGVLPDAGSGGSGDVEPRSRQLLNALTSVAAPEPGDLVFYPSGYALFWYRDQNREPFVIGMTPSGITALDPDFAEQIAVARPSYR